MIESAPFYFAICDGCGKNITEQGEHAAWSARDVAEDEVGDSGGAVCGELVVCDTCTSAFLAASPEDEWDDRYDALRDETRPAAEALRAFITERRQEAS
jgi:hypothetical protein